MLVTTQIQRDDDQCGAEVLVSRKDFAIIAVALSLVLGFIAFGVKGLSKRSRILAERSQDLQTLRGLCNTFTNINSTPALLATVQTWGVTLHSPIPKDPSKPCYVLVHSFDLNKPGMILISETNITDTNMVLIVTMDGSVQWLP